MDGQEDASVYTGPALDLSRKWSGGACSPAGVGLRHRRRTRATRRRPTDAVVVNGDNLYFFVHIRDDFQSYAVTPQECVAHWLADSVEFLIDPRGDSSAEQLRHGHDVQARRLPVHERPVELQRQRRRTARAGSVTPTTTRATRRGRSRRRSTAPRTRPGVQVVSTATWVGSNSTTVDHSYGAAGGYNLEVKIPLADLPAAVGPTSSPPTGSRATNTINPLHLGLNITPYDEDNTAAAGTTTLRHIDQSTRLALSNDTGGVQADPFRWGHAYIPGYTPPAGRSTTPTTPNVSHPNLDGVLSPQTIYQSATDGVPISGRNPAPANDSISIQKVKLTQAAAASARPRAAAADQPLRWSSTSRHRAGHRPHLPVDGRPREHPGVPVELRDRERPAAGLRLHAVRADRRRHPAVVARHERSRRQAGRRDVHEEGQAERQDRRSPQSQYDKLAADGSALISFETPNDEVQALFVPDFDK